MRRFLAFLLLAVLLASLTGCADDSGLTPFEQNVDRIIRSTLRNPEDSGRCGEDLIWYYKNKVVLIQGEGAMETWQDISDRPWNGYVDEINTVIVDEGCTSVSKHAFDGCFDLTRLHLPDSLQELGMYAFANCGLSEVRITKSLGEEYSDMISLAYQNNPVKRFVVDKQNEHYIAVDGVLFSARKKELVCYPWANLNIDYTIPEGTTRVMGFAFDGCVNLREVTIPESLVVINNRAFYGCESLQSIDLPPSVEEISDYAFYGCIRLREVRLPKYLERIGRYAFGACYKLQEIEIPANVKVLGENIFEDTPLTTLIYEGDAEGYPWGASSFMPEA